MKKKSKGFLLVEVLIACLILTGSIVASYHLLRNALDNYLRAQKSNQISKKVPQVIAFLENIAELEQKRGETVFSQNFLLRWEAKPLERTHLIYRSSNRTNEVSYEISLYHVKFTLIYKDYSRDFNYKILKYQNISFYEKSNKN